MNLKQNTNTKRGMEHEIRPKLKDYALLFQILIIQACQHTSLESNSEGAKLTEDASGGYPSDDLRSSEHIVLSRPHTLVLLASVAGGTAKRGVFTSALADQFCIASGHCSVYNIFEEAVKVAADERPDQVPELRSTLTKDCIICPTDGLVADDIE